MKMPRYRLRLNGDGRAALNVVSSLFLLCCGGALLFAGQIWPASLCALGSVGWFSALLAEGAILETTQNMQLKIDRADERLEREVEVLKNVIEDRDRYVLRLQDMSHRLNRKEKEYRELLDARSEDVIWEIQERLRREQPAPPNVPPAPPTPPGVTAPIPPEERQVRAPF